MPTDPLAPLTAALPTFLSIGKVVLGFGAVIFIHELGHFLAARWNGVHVEKFAIGFDFWGAKLAEWKRGETRYVIGLFPLGGYVKMLGQNDTPGGDTGPSQPDSFTAKTVWQRLQIISAGVFFNFLFAIFLCWMAFVVGFHRSPPVVGQVGYQALAAGLQPGDKVLRIDDQAVHSWDDIRITYAGLEPGVRASFLVERNGKEVAVAVPIHRDPAAPFNTPDFAQPAVARVSSVGAGSAADQGGIKPGDWLLSVDGQSVSAWSGFSDLIRRRGDKDTTLRVRRGEPGEETELDLVVRPRSKRPDLLPEYLTGIEPRLPPIIGYVAPGSPAAAAGLRVGERIVSVGEHAVDSWYGAWKEVLWRTPEGQPVSLSLLGADQTVRIVAVSPGEAPDWAPVTSSLPTLGIAGEPSADLVIGALVPGGPADLAGLQVGDRIDAFTVSIEEAGEVTVEKPGWDDFMYALSQLKTPTVAVSVVRGKDRLEKNLALSRDADAYGIGFLGVGAMAHEQLVTASVFEAVGPALIQPFRIVRDFAHSMQALALGRVSSKMMSGPIGILQATYVYAQKRTGDLLNFLALISMNLAIVNFLPIPVTDGGHAVFLLYEKIRGRRMDEAWEARFQWAGLLFLLSVFVLATRNDLGRIFGL